MGFLKGFFFSQLFTSKAQSLNVPQGIALELIQPQPLPQWNTRIEVSEQ